LLLAENNTMKSLSRAAATSLSAVLRLEGSQRRSVFVGVLTWLLYRRRPDSLVWPAAALLWVACYHVSGIFVNGRWLA